MRKKLLMAIALLVSGVGNLWADPTDVTSTNITNAGFEGDQTEMVTTSGGVFYQPTGWTFSKIPEASTYHYANKDASRKTEGDNSFKVRFNWASLTTELQQTVSDLPAGRYQIKADLRVYKKGSNASIEAWVRGSNEGTTVESSKKSSTMSNLETQTITIELKKQGDLKIELCMKNTNSNKDSENAVFWDNVKLFYEPFTPTASVKNLFGGTSEPSVPFSNFSTFTAEMTGTADNEIKFACFSYTPTADGLVRFIGQNGYVFVYENGVYKKYLDPSGSVSETGNLLTNADFSTVGDKTGSSETQFKLGDPWVTSGFSWGHNGGIRVNTAETAGASGNVLIWRGTANSNYFAQPLTGIKANTYYKIQVMQATSSNANAQFIIGLGNSAGDMSFASINEKLGTGYNGLHTIYLKTNGDATSDAFLSFKNTSSNTASSGSDPVTQIDWMSLIEVDNFEFTNATDVSILVGTAYAPSTPAEAKVFLNTEIGTANTITTNRINVGDNPFQIPSSAVDALEGAIATARAVYENSSATASEVESAVLDLQAEEANYCAAELKKPDKDIPYSLFLKDGESYAKTVTFTKGNTDEGGYFIGYTHDAGSIYNQAIHFESTGVKNRYYLYIKDADDNKLYVCTQATGYTSSDNKRIRVTDDKAQALPVEVIVSTTEVGEYNLKNTEADALLGSKGDSGFYTDSKYKTFNINEPTEASVSITIDEGKWGTRIFPFAVSSIDGLTAYTITGTNGDAIVKSDALASIPANTPVLLKASKDVNTSVSGLGLAYEDSYTEGYLTGVYTASTIAASDVSNTRYVLQTQGDVQAFYKVTSAFTASPNRCYLTVPVASGVKAFYLDGDETAVSSVKADELQGATIYNLAGQRVNKAQKGVYIINGKKVAVK